MRIDNRSAATKPEIRSLLYVGATDDDFVCVRKMLVGLWHVQHAPTDLSAIRELRRGHFDVVLCEKQLEGATWAEILEIVSLLPAGPVLVVASLFADEHLWAEALNLGAYDVLAKPFDPGEVNRVLLAATRYRERCRPAHATAETTSAAFAS